MLFTLVHCKHTLCPYNLHLFNYNDAPTLATVKQMRIRDAAFQKSKVTATVTKAIAPILQLAFVSGRC